MDSKKKWKKKEDEKRSNSLLHNRHTMTKNAVQVIPDKNLFGSFYELDVDKSTNLEIHFGQLNPLKLFLFKD